MPRLLPALLLATVAGGCAVTPLIPGTRVPDVKINHELIAVCEEYRHAMESRDIDKLLTLASPRYYEDSGTPKSEDDYGYDGLKTVLAKRIPSLRSIRYAIEYRAIDVSGSRAKIDIRYDASFQMVTAMGDRWEHKNSDKRLVLENDGRRWLFVAGM